jgi:hypothetical protein
LSQAQNAFLAMSEMIAGQKRAQHRCYQSVNENRQNCRCNEHETDVIKPLKLSELCT